MIFAVVLLGALRKRRAKKTVGVYGVYDNASEVFSERINFVKKAFLSPSFLVFVVLCAIQSVVMGVMLFGM